MNPQDSFVAGLRDATPQEAADAKAAAGLLSPDALAPAAAAPAPGKPPLSPGQAVERWPVKVGTDDDIGKVKVAKVIVDTTVAELGKLSRPPTWLDQSNNPPIPLQRTRFAPTETTVWRVDAQTNATRPHRERTRVRARR